MSNPEQAAHAVKAGFPIQDLAGTETRRAHAIEVVEHLIMAALLECCSINQYGQIKHSNIIEDLKPVCAQDALAFACKDPSSDSDIEIIARTSTSFAAVLHYRIAHWIDGHLKAPGSTMLAALLVRRGKLLSGAEIHFKCRIGKRFVLDHGYGTVIGETAVIGDDCYVLGGVTLGSRQIGDNTPGPRHPRLGDRVQVGMNSYLLGHIRIGDDVFIGSGCLVTRDVPAGHRVTLRNAQGNTAHLR